MWQREAGAVFDVFAGFEGVTAAQFISTISQRASAMESCHEHGGQTVCTPGSSKDRMKVLSVSPDALFLIAAHLTFMNSFGRVPEAHNFIDLRMLKYGSISRCPCTTVAIVPDSRPAISRRISGCPISRAARSAG